MMTIKLSGGDLGSETMLVRCDLSQASAPVQVDYGNGDGFEGTQYQCADVRHTDAGLIEIGKKLAAVAVEVPADQFECEAEEITLQDLLGDDDADEALIVIMCRSIKEDSIKVEIETEDGEPEALNDDDTLWVVSDHKLVVGGETVAKWTRCGMGSWGEAGRQGLEDEWCVQEDDNGGDTLPARVAIALDALGLEDDFPSVPAPAKASETYTVDPDGEYGVYWDTVGDDAHVVRRYATPDAALAVCGQMNREFSAKNPSGGGTAYLCGYVVRTLVDGKWEAVESD